MPIPHLSAIERKILRGKATQLKPIIQVGKNGLTDTLLATAKKEINDRKLIKIKFSSSDRSVREEQLAKISEFCEACVCGVVGKTASLFRDSKSLD